MNADFAKALIGAQSEIKTMPKDKSGYGYKYTDLDTIFTTIKPILNKYKLGFVQMLRTSESGKTGIDTVIFHENGESFQAFVEIPAVQVGKANNAQNIGAAITYMKRYAICAALGISSDEDVDANVTPQPQARPQATQQRPRQQAPQNNGGYNGAPY